MNKHSSEKRSRYKLINREALCGFNASLMSVIINYPMNKLMFRYQICSSIKESIVSIKNERICLLYRGLLPPLIHKTLSATTMFGLNEYIMQHAFNKRSAYIPLAGSLTGITECVLIPLERTMVLLQDPFHNHKFQNTLKAMFYMLKVHGLIELYRGFVVICIRNSVSNAMFFTSKDLLRKKYGKSLNNASNFINGGLLGASISTLMYPLFIIKCHMQRRLGGGFCNIPDAVRTLRRTKKLTVRSMYNGGLLNFTRALMGWGTMNALYEYFVNLNKVKLVSFIVGFYDDDDDDEKKIFFRVIF